MLLIDVCYVRRPLGFLESSQRRFGGHRRRRMASDLVSVSLGRSARGAELLGQDHRPRLGASFLRLTKLGEEDEE